AAEVIVEELVLALVGLSAGAAVAGGLFSFIVELGVIADFADRTHTGDKLLFYETCVALGGIIGNIVFLFYSFPSPRKQPCQPVNLTLSQLSQAGLTIGNKRIVR
ncbi:stage V sporulation protein AB, partial [Prevotella pectinovora]|uniref:stage V sporulation protein AB n=1 Tax=Prevotella pectinovora TaxID=1602169 RepID=UPI003A8EC193